MNETVRVDDVKSSYGYLHHQRRSCWKAWLADCVSNQSRNPVIMGASE